MSTRPTWVSRRRRPLSLELRLRLTQVGLVLIVALMLFVVGNDLLRYVIH